MPELGSGGLRAHALSKVGSGPASAFVVSRTKHLEAWQECILTESHGVGQWTSAPKPYLQQHNTEVRLLSLQQRGNPRLTAIFLVSGSNTVHGGLSPGNTEVTGPGVSGLGLKARAPWPTFNQRWGRSTEKATLCGPPSTFSFTQFLWFHWSIIQAIPDSPGGLGGRGRTCHCFCLCSLHSYSRS